MRYSIERREVRHKLSKKFKQQGAQAVEDIDVVHGSALCSSSEPASP
jgi:hypothetical protein